METRVRRKDLSIEIKSANGEILTTRDLRLATRYIKEDLKERVKMKKSSMAIVSGLVVGIVIIGTSWCYAQQRSNNYYSNGVFMDYGNGISPFTVSVGTTTPVQVYSASTPVMGNYDSADRRVVIQNYQNYTLYCGTVATVSATSGNRFVVASSQTVTLDSVASIYCIYQSASGAGTKEVLGWVNYDTRD